MGEIHAKLKMKTIFCILIILQMNVNTHTSYICDFNQNITSIKNVIKILPILKISNYLNGKMCKTQEKHFVKIFWGLSTEIFQDAGC